MLVKSGLWFVSMDDLIVDAGTSKDWCFEHQRHVMECFYLWCSNCSAIAYIRPVIVAKGVIVISSIIQFI